MAKYLFVVESPGKVAKIQNFLGKDYKVVASIGHIMELEKGSKGVDKKNDFKPAYKISEDKKDVVKSLKELAKDVEIIYIGTDHDREGAGIGWHVKEITAQPDKKYRRVVFTEITKKAIEDAIKNPIGFDKNLIDSQQTRRVLDRLVGFDLSPLLWKKIQRGLSAGRVQSVGVKILVEREKEIRSFEGGFDFKTVGNFETDTKHKIKALLNKKFKTKDESKDFLKKCIDKNFSIKDIEVKPGKKSPSAPFITSSLQQTASSQLGFAVSRTMQAAQKLYEGGHITYMRTDSTLLSDEFLGQAQKEVESRYGKKYHNKRQFQSKSKNAQEAHEAVRPTYIELQSAGNTSDEVKLYELIWKRTIASQMADAEVERTTATIGTAGVKEDFIAKGEVFKFDGFTKVYTEQKEEDNEDDDSRALPPIKKGQKLDVVDITSGQTFTKPPARYTEASLVKKLEELGIGRPSTYATIIKTIQDRGYVEKKDLEAQERKIESLTLTGTKIDESIKIEKFGSEKGKMMPTDIGIVVTDYLQEHFKDVMDYKFTAGVEEQLDEIANGTLNWVDMLKSFYGPFSETVKAADKVEGKVGERALGNDPKTGKPVIVRIGKFGPMVQLGTSLPKEPKVKEPKVKAAKGKTTSKTKTKKEEKSKAKEVNPEDKPKFAKLKEGQNMETITLEEALKLLSWPKNLGQHKGEDVTVAIGRFGPYVKYKDEFFSISKEEDPAEVTLKRAVEIMEEKIEAKKNYILKDFKSKKIQVLNGKFGPYIKAPGGNYKITPEKEPKELTLEDCESIIENGKSSNKGGKGKFKKGSKGKKK